ncbi:MAG: hypothetical protein V2J25_01305 [Desulfatiglans sp.]|jgi:hypothetical protein|nr:hypothetical protein [Thermodesulfobacteriota bacterium]MEE4351483.1 hypothetical protein [Desulfatiglans sp.]
MARGEKTKKIWLWSAVIICSLGAIYLGLFAFVSLSIGFSHTEQSGFWVPLVAGILSLIALFLFFLFIVRHIISHIRDDDLLGM